MQSKAFFIQTLTSETFEQLLSERICAAKTTQCGSDEVQLTYEEENAIRYMAGFAVRRLQKQLGVKDIDMLIESDEAAISDANSSEWINLIDQGGLVHVNDACYQLFLAIEHATRQELQVSKVGSMDDGFRTYLENMLSTDDDILFNWTMITGNETEREDVLKDYEQDFLLTKYKLPVTVFNVMHYNQSIYHYAVALEHHNNYNPSSPNKMATSCQECHNNCD